MTPYWYIENNFDAVRAKRIGASDLAACIPNPEKPNESLAGHERTAYVLWQEKTGRREREKAGLPAEMGKWNEIKAIELFIRGIPEIGPSMAAEYVESRLRYETAVLSDPNRRASRYQPTPFKHNTQWYNDQFVVHPDGIWYGSESVGSNDEWIDMKTKKEYRDVHAHGLTIDLSSPFLIEAKNSSYWAAKRRNGSAITCYDLELKTWQGIPLKHYVQIQFQLACLDVETCYLPLLYDSASFHVWEIKRDRKTGDKLIDLAGRIAWHIKHDEPPKDLAMNADDIAAMYPEYADDYRFIGGDDADAVLTAARTYRNASDQEKAWSVKKKDAADALACHLKDAKELRVNLDGEVVPVVRWEERKGAERIIGLKEIKEGKKEVYEYLVSEACIKQGEASKFPKVCLKED